ncbi:DUF547 domain-containing protein [Eionea flava]
MLINSMVGVAYFYQRQYWLALSFLAVAGMSMNAIAAPKKVLLPEWQAYDESSRVSVDHGLWQAVLDRYLVTDALSQTYVNYSGLKAEATQQEARTQALGKKQPTLLEEYMGKLLAIDPLTLNRNEQKAYWLNLYNAATVQLMVKHYPVSSITKVGGGFFSFGPWNDEILTINNQLLSLNDIEHGILRPIYDDPRIHYGVNCASLSCPNLLAQAFTADNTEQLLDQAARDYINHPRGVSVEAQKVTLSKIYDWYQEDFNHSANGVLQHVRQYANAELIAVLDQLNQPYFRYAYDWQLNDWLVE